MAKKQNPVGDDMADKILADLEAEFGELNSASARAQIRYAITQGLIEFDEANEKLFYTLQKPVTLNDGSELKQLAFEEPTVEQIERMNKGIETKGKADGTFTITGDAQTKMTARMASIIAGVPVAHISKIKRRDFQVLEALQDFFA